MWRIKMSLEKAIKIVKEKAKIHYGSLRFFNETKMLQHLIRQGASKQIACNAIIAVQQS